MYFLFVLLWIATVIAICFWIVKYVKFKKEEKNNKGFKGLKKKIKNVFKSKEKQAEESQFTIKQIKKYLIIAIVVSFMSLMCVGITAPKVEIQDSENGKVDIYSEDKQNTQNGTYTTNEKENKSNENNTQEKVYTKADIEKAISEIPAYSKDAYAVVNNNIPFFNDTDLTTKSYENYSDLDSLERCGVAVSSIGKDIMPTEERGNIGSIKPTGWHSVRYDGIDGNYLYNRCHLIGYQLTGENANKKNLITGTRYMNVTGMLPFENMVADYIKETNNHVLYRVTPVFEGDNLLASGVLIEAKSVEDDGEGIEFNVYCYNVQPGITIDYATGESSGPEFKGSTSTSGATTTTVATATTTNKEKEAGATTDTSSEKATDTNTNTNTNTNITTYILNTNTKKYHRPSCGSVSTIKESNKQTYEGTSEELDSKGYEPCKRCNPQ